MTQRLFQRDKSEGPVRTRGSVKWFKFEGSDPDARFLLKMPRVSMEDLVKSLRDTLHEQDYKEKESPNALLLCAFRNWNMNRGVAWVELEDVPENLGGAS